MNTIRAFIPYKKKKKPNSNPQSTEEISHNLSRRRNDDKVIRRDKKKCDGSSCTCECHNSVTPICAVFQLEENSLGRGIIIEFNKKYKFLADEKLVTKKSNLLNRMIQENPKKKTSYKVDLPYFEYTSFFVDYLKTGKYCSFELHMFPIVYNNAKYLECFSLLQNLEQYFRENFILICKLTNFRKYINNQVFAKLMFSDDGKKNIGLNKEKNGANMYCKIFYNTLDSDFDKNVNLADLSESFPYLWRLAVEFDLPYLKKDLEGEFANLINKNPKIVRRHRAMNSKFISHIDFQYLLICYLDLRLYPVRENPNILTMKEKHAFVLKDWLEKHPDFDDEWFETFRFILARL